MSTIIYNPKKGAPIKEFRWLGGKWELAANTMAKFPKEIAKEMLKRYEFLMEVAPEKISDVKKMMIASDYQCEYCDYGADTEQKLRMHKLAKHKLSKENQDILDEIPEAQGEKVGSVIPVQGKKTLSIEESEGIPNTSRGEVDGWYGEGLQAEMPVSFGVKKAGSPGNFGAS